MAPVVTCRIVKNCGEKKKKKKVLNLTVVYEEYHKGLCWKQNQKLAAEDDIFQIKIIAFG